MEALGGGRDIDEEMVAIVENDSCAVDAIQVLTGCTLGKGNLIFRDYGKQHLYKTRREKKHEHKKLPSLALTAVLLLSLVGGCSPWKGNREKKPCPRERCQ